jgi:type IX secretion system membrane protein PorP/SprF
LIILKKDKMNKYLYIFLVLLVSLCTVDAVKAGNPDRQGESGAAQLLLNPWARTAGLHTMTTSYASGVEAMRINPAGVVRINNTEFVIANTRYLDGTDITLNAFGLAKKVGKNGALGVSIMAVDLGDILVTTTEQPEGTGATFSPSLFNLGLGYSHIFENKVSVGIILRIVSESTADISAFGIAVDAGVQYVTGPQDNFKFGISLRNVGTPMKFSGQGLSEQAPSSGQISYELTYFQRAQQFELPSALNIGGSYDFVINPKSRLTVVTNFTSNSFSQDQIGAGVEYAFNNMFMLRGGYKYELGSFKDDSLRAPVYDGVSAGVSVEVPMKRGSDKKFGIDYAYRQSRIWNGTHNIAVRFSL